MPHAALLRTDHRPWPLPPGRWTWRQSWCDLLFAHWPVPAATLRHLVPPELEIQELDGTSWVGIVPFRMEGVAPRPLPDLPWISAFPELNLRLYVECDGRPGVWFLSLDATNRLAVWAARRFFHLPYLWSRIAVDEDGAGFRFACERREGPAPMTFRSSYRPTSDPFESVPGTLDHWLTERYCLYARSPGGELLRAEVHHHPWSLQRAEAEVTARELTSAHGFEVHGPPVLLHFARRIDVVVWSPTAVRTTGC